MRFGSPCRTARRGSGAGGASFRCWREAPLRRGAIPEGEAGLVLGGTIVDLPLARLRVPGGALLIDPVTGLFPLL